MRNLSFRTKVSILVFLTSFTFFMGFILIEDLLILKPFLKEMEGWDKSRRLVRLIFGLCFSILTASITAYSFNFFYGSLRNLIHFIQSWREDGNREDIQITRNDEIGSLVRSLQIALYQEDERTEQKIKKSILQEKRRLYISLHERIETFPLKKIPGLDISLFPKSTKNLSNDYMQIIPTDDGCIGILMGFETPGVRETAFKKSVHSIFRYIQNSGQTKGYSIFKAIADTLEIGELGLLNLSLFHLDAETGDLNYFSWQDTPPFIRGEMGIRELEKSSLKHVPQGEREEESFHANLAVNETLFWISDRLLKKIHLTGKQVLNELDRRIFQEESHSSNTRTTTLGIANHISKRYGKKALERLGIIAIRRTK